MFNYINNGLYHLEPIVPLTKLQATFESHKIISLYRDARCVPHASASWKFIEFMGLSEASHPLWAFIGRNSKRMPPRLSHRMLRGWNEGFVCFSFRSRDAGLWAPKDAGLFKKTYKKEPKFGAFSTPSKIISLFLYFETDLIWWFFMLPSTFIIVTMRLFMQIRSVSSAKLIIG